MLPTVLRVLLALALVVSGSLPGSSLAFGFADVAASAQALAAQTFKPAASNLPDELKKLSFSQYQEIRFRPDHQPWHKARLKFDLAFFHEGLDFDWPVKINEVVSGRVREIPFDVADFDYGASKVDPNKARGLGFAGFRVQYAFPKNGHAATHRHSAKQRGNASKHTSATKSGHAAKDEVAVFVGATYFRAVANGQRYGLSARALAIDTGLPSGEEFPRFVEFWIERPGRRDEELTLYALLESKSAVGAYRFTLSPGTRTVMTVSERLYLREKVEKLCLAPLSSMFLFGENQRPDSEDFRPEVHDSDGLLVETGAGGWTWRPLVNPKRLLVSSLPIDRLRGFGLMQRDRSFASYEDLAIRRELHPSAWVEPVGDWGSGRIELVEIPTPDDTNNNIVAFWVPKSPPAPGTPLELHYRLLWQDEVQPPAPLAHVIQTRRGPRSTGKADNSITFTVDFAGGALAKLPADAKVSGQTSVDANGQLIDTHTIRNEVSGGWRVVLHLRRIDDKKPVEVHTHLQEGNETVSETWSYLLPPV